MSNDFFKVKKGLNIKPQDPSSLTDLQDGDIIVDSTDDNRMKVYDSVGGDFASVGTGGSSGNIMSDIEKLTPVVTNVVATTDTVTFLPIDDNNKSVKATFSGSDGSIRYEAPASADLDGVQGLVKVWIKTSLENLSLVATKDGVAQNNGVTINSTNKWRQYEIPVVLGDADYGFEVQASGSVAGDVYIDEAFVTVESVIRNLGQAHFVGSLTYSATNCVWAKTTTGAGDFPVDTDCLAENITGSALAPDTKLPAIKIPNVRTDGYYKANFQGLQYTQSGSACWFALSASSSDENQGWAYTDINDKVNNTLDGTFRFSTNGDKTIRVISKASATTQCAVYGTLAEESKFSVHFYPDDTSTVVTQDTELLNGRFIISTTQTATQSGADIVFGATSTYSGVNNLGSAYDTSTGVFTVQKTGYYEFESALIPISVSQNVRPWIGLSVNGTVLIYSSDSTGAQITNSLLNLSTGSLYLQKGDTVKIVASSGDANSRSLNASESNYFHIREVSINKNVVGKFENINDTEILESIYMRSTAQTIPPTVDTDLIFDLKETDNTNGAYNPSTGIFTSPRDTAYEVCMTWLWDNAGWGVNTIYFSHIKTSDGRTINLDRQEIVSTQTNYYPMKGCQYLTLNKDQTLKVTAHQSSGGNRANIASSTYNRLSIIEKPDLIAVVKNLSNQKTKCQVKYLSADISASGSIADWSLANLEIAKRYSLEVNSMWAFTSTDNVAVRVTHDGVTLFDINQGMEITSSTSISTTQKTVDFVATATTVTFATVSQVSADLRGNGTKSESYIKLCELPDTYVETDEW